MTATPPPISSCLTEIARLGGYLGRRHDPPPGNMIMWRGWTRLMDIQLGIELAAEPLLGIESFTGWLLQHQMSVQDVSFSSWGFFGLHR